MPGMDRCSCSYAGGHHHANIYPSKSRGELLQGKGQGSLKPLFQPPPPPPCLERGSDDSDFCGDPIHGKKCCWLWYQCFMEHGSPGPSEPLCSPQLTSSNSQQAPSDAQLTGNRHPTDWSWFGANVSARFPDPPEPCISRFNKRRHVWHGAITYQCSQC